MTTNHNTHHIAPPPLFWWQPEQPSIYSLALDFPHSLSLTRTLVLAPAEGPTQCQKCQVRSGLTHLDLNNVPIKEEAGGKKPKLCCTDFCLFSLSLSLSLPDSRVNCGFWPERVVTVLAQRRLELDTSNSIDANEPDGMWHCVWSSCLTSTTSLIRWLLRHFAAST